MALGVGAAAATGLGPGVATAAPDGSGSSASSDAKSNAKTETKSDTDTKAKDRETTTRETADPSSDAKSEAEPKRPGSAAQQTTDRVRSTLDRLSQRQRPGSALRRAVRDALDDIADRPVRPLPTAKPERPAPEAGVIDCRGAGPAGRDGPRSGC
ncbi:hypothetical protein MCHIJ_05860 [Mycolicibacterium chitae]|uniref:Uncharacterized protein n=1 Tax=Mycolicibacterium chitae TaxID=1792 RepID=A0A448ICH7_MYCCI|nr:hypothetical protein [Mycolicibacterium chitae]MCV7108171.1 hypothetical protein [Mycolicibacterium chitae]BBZ01149.1 hypothetical protein MCHIJ_05860 [Mycolicibacterium chitae]VEG49987.1 Uncharacterised protein [Mycolicibacterium chitae]